MRNDHTKQFEVFIYHANCVDGLTAVAIAAHCYPDAERIPLSHGDSLTLKELADKHVCFLDISIKKPQMLSLLELSKSVTVIDHHVSSYQELLEIQSPNFNFVYDVTKSGAQLAWDYFINKPEPLFISYVGDRDLWTKRYKDSDALSMAIRVLEWEYEEMQTHVSYLVHNEIVDLDEISARYVTQGKAFTKYHNYMVDQICDQADRAYLDDGTPVLKVNCPLGLMSDVGAKLANKVNSGVAWLYYVKENTVKHSLRVSDNSGYDASVYCSSKGGGGHKKAAGWIEFLTPF